MKQDVLTTFSDEDSFLKASVRLIATICDNKKGVVRIGLSGGSTPGALYKACAQEKNLPFERIELYQVDERYVPKDHSESNYRLIKDTFGELVLRELRGFYFFDTSLPVEESVQKYEDILLEVPDQQLDLVILGIGPDGHTASLFPHSQALQENTCLTAHSTTDQFAVHDRLTVTFPLILKSQQLLVLLKGKEKQTIIDELLYSSKSVEELPAKALLKHSNYTMYFLK